MTSIINPLFHPNYDEEILRLSKASVFHSSAWARVLSESYGYEPFYFGSTKNGRILSLLPVMEIRSLLTGARGVSLPFTDLCPEIAEDQFPTNNHSDQIASFGKIRKWRYFELRGARFAEPKWKPFCSYYSHELDLRKGEKELFSNLRGSTKRNIKKAVKEGVEVECSSSLQSLRTFYNLHCTTRKKHGLPPQPFKFFKKLHQHLISKGHGLVSLANYHGKMAAGAVYLHFGKKAVYKFGASDPKYTNVRPNNQVMWESIRRYINMGFESLAFGRTDMDNEGLLQFKRGWGVEEKVIDYYLYDLSKSKLSKKKSLKLPTPFSKISPFRHSEYWGSCYTNTSADSPQPETITRGLVSKIGH